MSARAGPTHFGATQHAYLIPRQDRPECPGNPARDQTRTGGRNERHGRTPDQRRSPPPSWSGAGRRCARRWRRSKIDVLVMQNSNEFSGGYVKWFTDMPSGNGTMTTVIFPEGRPDDRGRAGAVRRRRHAAAGRSGAARRQALPRLAELHGRVVHHRARPREHRQGDGGILRRHHRARGAGLDGARARRAPQARQARQCALCRRDRAGRPDHGDQERRGDRADPRHRASAGPRHARGLRRHQARHARHRGDGGGGDLHPHRRRRIRPADGRVVADRRSR